MSARTFGMWLALGCALQALLACSFDSDANEARGCDATCEVCHLGFCVATRQDGVTASGGTGGTGATGGTGTGGASGTSGASGAGTGGASGVGAGAGGGAGIGGAGGMMAGVGGTMAGVGGMTGGSSGMGPCVPATESCDGEDDDCDGAIDEGTDAACYPAGTAGCTTRADGSFDCKGMCTPGMQRCEGGALTECSGFDGPKQELCGAQQAADEDCDGNIDDGCPCSAGETQACYGGPLFTRGVGQCKDGEQTCESGGFGACVGEVLPGNETCANAGVDNDCDLDSDDVAGRGNLCFDFGKQGVCWTGTRECQGNALVCETPEPAAEEACDELDDDCDGAIDEGFAFASDENNCGECGVRCGADQLCCGGMCRSVQSDEAHCGGCDDACGTGLTCCGGDCTATDTDAHCGGCNMACAANQDCCGGACAAVDTPARCGGCNIACESGQDCCEGSCTDLDTADHCGACTTACGEAQDCCSGSCTPVDTNPNCGACNVVCTEPCACIEGACRDALGDECL